MRPIGQAARSTIHIQINDKVCSGSRNVHHVDAATGEDETLKHGTTDSNYLIPDTPAGAGVGKYYFEASAPSAPDSPGQRSPADGMIPALLHACGSCRVI